jgi:molybdopterin-containing oxidoreductase family iron-sulfur binding subunit
MLPSCVTSCVGYATYFGDGNDPNSIVSKFAAAPRMMRIKEELGTNPTVYYLT